MKSRILCLAVLLALPAFASAQTGYSITGGMSNFDCSNRCDDPCDEFEVEIEDCRPEDVIHTYANSNYGAPSVSLSADGTYTIIDYHNPHHPTAVGALEHFGISLRQLGPTNVIRVRWMRNGQPATVNGQVPVQGGGTAPATQPRLPSISAEMSFGSTGGDGIMLSVTNNDPVQGIWIKRSAQVSQGVVSLEALMRDNPVVTTTVPIDTAPVYLGPGYTLSNTSDLVEVEDNESVVFAAQYFQDLTQNAGPFNGNTHSVGPELGNVMTASIASPDTGCDMSAPFIAVQPQSVTANEGQEVQISVDADGNDLPLTYQWLKEGIELTNGGHYSGVTRDELAIDSLVAATEGFYSVRVSNSCGITISDSALVFITGHNPPPPPVCLSISSQPKPVSTYNYNLAEFTVSADGPGTLSYRWQVADVTTPGAWLDLEDGPGTDGGEVVFDAVGTDGPLLDIFAAQSNPSAGGSATGRFRCIATTSCGSVTSSPALLTVLQTVGPDLDGDGDVDGDDLVLLSGCTTGPGVSYLANGLPATCGAAVNNQDIVAVDFDSDGDVDQDDFGIFQRCFSGPGNLADPNCAH